MKVYVLSYDSYIYKNNEKLFIYRWVPVGWAQVKDGMTATKVIPDNKPGSLVTYSIEDKGQTLFRVMADGRLRTVTKEEMKDHTMVQIPRI